MFPKVSFRENQGTVVRLTRFANAASVPPKINPFPKFYLTMKKTFMMLSALVCMTFFSGCFTFVGTTPGHGGGGPAIDAFVEDKDRVFYVTDIYGNTPLRDFVLQGYWTKTSEKTIYLSVNYEQMCERWQQLSSKSRRKITPLDGVEAKAAVVLRELPKGFSKITENYLTKPQEEAWIHTKHVNITGNSVFGFVVSLVADIITSPIQIPFFTVTFGYWLFEDAPPKKPQPPPPPPTWTREDIDAALEKSGH
jgi:hypothetical protein